MARVHVFVSNLGDIIANTESSWPGIRWGVPADCDALIAAGVSTAWLDRAIARGARFVVAEENGRIIGQTICLTEDSVWQYDWLLIRLNASEDMLTAASFVIPERRGRRVFSSIKRFAAQHFSEAGYRRMIGVVEASNEASIMAHRRIGAVRSTTLRRTRIGRLRLVWRSGALPHIRWGAEPFRVSV